MKTCVKWLAIVVLTWPLLGCGGGGGSTSSSAPVVTQPATPTPTPDTTAPVVTLNGEQALEVSQGQTFSDPGASAIDDIDGSVSVSVAGEVGAEPGVYTLTYSATDSAGNSGQAVRTVTVIAAAFDLATASVEEILAQMTLEQKVGQMIQAEIGSISLDDITRYGIGSVLNGGGSYPDGKRSATVREWLNYARALRTASSTATPNALGIPLLWGTDAVHGHNNVRGATIFPHNIGLGAIDDSQLVREIAVATAKEVGATGIDWIFAPTVAQAKDYRWGRTYESYSDDPDLVREYARQMVSGIQSQGIAATAKHFIGDGGTRGGVDQGDTAISLSRLIDEHGSGFSGAIDADIDTVMATFNSWNGTKVHGSKTLLTDVLRDQLGFEGLVISDWNGIGQVAGCSNSQCAGAINAGIDMVMVPTEWLGFRDALIAQVEQGDVSLERIDEAVLRILTLKKRLGLFDPNFDPARFPEAIVGNTSHRQLAREAVRRSQVLLKNNDSVLPLAGDENILLVGAAGDSLPLQAGGWSVTWQGTGTTNSDFPGGTTLREAINQVVSSSGGGLEYSPQGEYQSRPDVVIVVLAEPPYAEGAGDRTSLDWPSSAELARLQPLRDEGVPVITILFTGRPMWVNPEINQSDAFLVSWLPGTEASGIADVIFSIDDADASGKLPFPWPGGAINAADPSLPVGAHLFPRGYGLSFTDSEALPLISEDPNNALGGVVGDGGGGTEPPTTPPVSPPTATDPFVVLDNGEVNSVFDRGVSAFDAATGFSVCSNDEGAACPSISWQWVNDSERGEVLEISHGQNADFAAVFFEATVPQDLSAYQQGLLRFDIKHNSGPNAFRVKLDCVYPCTSADIDVPAITSDTWQTVELPVTLFTQTGLDLTAVSTGLVIWAAQHDGTQFLLDNVMWVGDASETGGSLPNNSNPSTGTGGSDLNLEGLSGGDNVSPMSYPGMTMIWSDEFDGPALDRATWQFDIGGGGWGNEESQYYREGNASVAAGHLVITAKEEAYGGRAYTSSRIKTQGLKTFKYGRVDIRAALPRGQGIWPALWALGSNFTEVGWPYCGEIDIMEMIGGGGRESTVHGTVHWNVGGLSAPYSHTYIGGSTQMQGDDFGAGFNVFSIVRTEQSIKWLVNDNLFYTFSLDSSASLAPFKEPFFLIFNVAVGGIWPGYPDASTNFPQRLVVDYVRVFE